MGYQINIEGNGFEFKFGNLGVGDGVGLFISCTDPKIKTAIQESDPKFLETILEILNSHEFLDAQYTMDTFEHYILQGHGWHSLMESYSFKGLSEFKYQAELILSNEEHASDYQRQIAKTILDTLEGNGPRYQVPEKTQEEKVKASFERKKPKLKLKLVMRDGYKCHNCGQDKEDSLCIVQKEIHETNYELENLTLRCRSCMNKLKKKK